MIGGREVRADRIIGAVQQGNLTAAGNITITTNIYAEPQAAPPQENWWATRKPGKDRYFDQLNWRARLTDLVGRGAEMAELRAWATSDGRVRARLLTGPGGAGKTRLSVDLAQALAVEGWRVHKLERTWPGTIPIAESGLLLIVDYPEEQTAAVQGLLEGLERLGPDGPGRIRVLLASRRGEGEWERVWQTTHTSALFDAPPVTLSPLPEADGWQVFQSALTAMAGVNERAVPRVDRAAFDAWAERERTRVDHLPLFIAALALHTVLEPEKALSFTGAEVMAALAEREIARARNESRACGLPEEALPRLLALACIADGLDADSLARVADPQVRLGLTGDGDLLDRIGSTGRVVMDGNRQRRVLAPLTPDLPAAAFVTTVFAAAPDSAPDWLWAAIAGDPDRAVERLARLCFDADVTLGLLPGENAWKRLSRRAVAMVAGRAERALALEGVAARDDLGHCLAPLQAKVAEVLLQTDSLPPEARAHLLHNRSVDLAAGGDSIGALAAIREAVELRRVLARDAPARFTPALAGSLTNLSNCLSYSGDSTGALAAIREAVELYRRLAQDTPARFRLDLAGSLNNLSNRLSDSGDGAGALAAIREAVELRRGLARDDPARFRLDLASSLNNLSNRLSDRGDSTGALAAIREAVELYRGLAWDNPARFTPDLAMSLTNLSNRLSDSGDGAGALAAIREAVELLRGLARDNPARFTPYLASSLNNLSLDLSDSGDSAGSLAAIREAVELRRELARDNPARFNPDLAGSLAVWAQLAFASGKREEALALIEEAITLIGPQARAFPDSQAGRRLVSMQADRARYLGADGMG